MKMVLLHQAYFIQQIRLFFYHYLIGKRLIKLLSGIKTFIKNADDIIN